MRAMIHTGSTGKVLLTRGPFVLAAGEAKRGPEPRHFTFSFKAVLQIVQTRDFIPSYLPAYWSSSARVHWAKM